MHSALKVNTNNFRKIINIIKKNLKNYKKISKPIRNFRKL